MLRNNLKKITLNDAVDKTFVPFVPEEDRVYTLKYPLIANMKALTAALIIPGANNIRHEIKEGWEYILFNYDNMPHYIAFKSKNGEFTEFKTNCSSFLIQDVFHSLYELPKDSPLKKDTLNKIIKSLSTIGYAIRELGKEDKQYRSDQRKIAELAQGNMSDNKLLERQAQYRELPFMRSQLKLKQMVLEPLTDDDVYLSGTENFEYHMSFPKDLHSLYSDKHRSKVDFGEDIDVKKSGKDYIKRVSDVVGYLSRVKYLEVGFGLGKTFPMLATSFPSVSFYGMEPNKKAFDIFMNLLDLNLYPVLKKENFFQETVQDFAKRKEHQGTFDIIVISAFDIPFPERDKAFEAIAALCKPDARLIITCMNSDYADPFNKAGDENRADARNSILPHLFKYFGEVMRGPYSEESEVHRFLFVCAKPKAQKNFLHKLPHVTTYGPIQRYQVMSWTKEMAELTVELGGSFQYCDQTETSAYIWLPSEKMKSKASGGHRETFGLDRLGLSGKENNIDEAAQKIYLLQKLYPEVTVEANPDQHNSYLITFPKNMRLALEKMLKTNPNEFEKGIVSIQAFMRGFIVRKTKKELEELSQKNQDALKKHDYNTSLQLVTQMQEAKRKLTN